jgi:hypothetical protein
LLVFVPANMGRKLIFANVYQLRIKMSSNISTHNTAMNATKKDKKLLTKKPVDAIQASTEPIAAAPVAAPVAATEPVASPVTAPVKTSFQEEATTTMSQLSAIQDAVKAAIASLKELEKRHKREVKDARKRRKRNTKSADSNGGDDDAASATGAGTVVATREIRPCVFTTPIPLDENLAIFLNKMPGEMICPKDITHLVNVYVTEHNLKDKSIIKPDAAMAKVFDIPAGATTTHRDLQRKIYKIIKDKL